MCIRDSIQALLNNPDFLIIDEPTTGLDPEERIRIRNLLVDFSKDRTVLFSTNVVEDLAATCTQLAILKKGSFLYSGSLSGLLENAKGCVWNLSLIHISCKSCRHCLGVLHLEQ